MTESGSAESEDHDNPRRVDVELFITHPTMSVAEMGVALGLEAHYAHNIGDQRKTPKGNALEGRYPDSRWRHCVRHTVKDQQFANKVTLFVQAIAAHKTFLHHVRNSGGHAELIIQFLGDGYLGDSIPLATLSTIADLKLDIGIECYVVPQK